MFNTVKAKVSASVLLILAVLSAVFLFYMYIFRANTKLLMLKNYSYSINSFVEKLNKQILSLEDNSRDLAIIGSLFYKTDRSVLLTKEALTQIFNNYKNSLGGGIWFEPYVIDKDKERMCFYAYKNKDKKVIFDESFGSEEYNYHNQSWYKQIKAQITEENDTAWSFPYYENFGSHTLMITAGTGIFENGKLIGMSTVDWELDTILRDISDMKPIADGFDFFDKNKKIKDSFSLFADKNFNYIIATDDPYLDSKNLTGKTLSNIPWYSDDLDKVTYINYHGKKYVPYIKTAVNGMMLVICVPKNEMFFDIERMTFGLLLFLLFTAFAIPALLYAVLNRNLIKPIDKLIDSADKISRGEDVKIKIENPSEFARLASAFDKMTGDIKSAAAEREKINSELSIAKSIQESTLPNVFPPFPENPEFDISASMEPAKEVGGDFYDFYFIDENKFMFLIADVSGKGIPAALFMMTVKTLINNIVQTDKSPQELINNINRKICAVNSQGFFVTMFSGIADISTGGLYLVNCGHNPPLIKHKNGGYEYLRLETNLPLGAINNFDYKIYKTVIETGDILFTYTDGITEALNDKDEMYGEKRLIEFLNMNKNEEDVQELINKMREEIKKYTNSVPQSDDITMLAFKFNELSKPKAGIYKAEASVSNCAGFLEWLRETAAPWNLDKALLNKINVCAEEIFINSASYAYPDKPGMIKAFLAQRGSEIILKIEDSGFAYNPLEQAPPDITLSAEEREPGGLGIFMVKQISDKVTYERIDGRNILTMIFKRL